MSNEEAKQKLVRLEHAADVGDLGEVIELLEDDNLKAIAANNNNRVLRKAAMHNQHSVVDYLLEIQNIKEARSIFLPKEAQENDKAQLLSLLNTASGIPTVASAYFELIHELLLKGTIFDLDWKYLPLALKAAKGPYDKKVVSYICVLPSVRQRVNEDQEFAQLFWKAKAWLRGKAKKPVPDDVPHVGPYVVKTGVSPFNLVAYEKFVAEKAVVDKLREHYTEDDIQRFYPGRFTPKTDSKEYHSITIQNNRIYQNGVRKGPIK